MQKAFDLSSTPNVRCCIAIFAFHAPEHAPVWRTRAAHQTPRTRAPHQSGGRLRKLVSLQSRRPERPRSSRDHRSKPLGAIYRSSPSTFSAGATLKSHPGSRIPGPGSGIPDPGSGIRDPGSRDPGTRVPEWKHRFGRSLENYCIWCKTA